MSANTVRQRGSNKDKALPASPASPSQTRDSKANGSLDKTIDQLPQAVKSEWDYKLALLIITSLAFVTRFWGIGHPNEVVFDEVHFGKVSTHWQHVQAFLPNRILPRLHSQLARTDFNFRLVCIILSPTNLLLRRTSTFRQATFRSHGMVCWLRWSLPLR